MPQISKSLQCNLRGLYKSPTHKAVHWLLKELHNYIIKKCNSLCKNTLTTEGMFHLCRNLHYLLNFLLEELHVYKDFKHLTRLNISLKNRVYVLVAHDHIIFFHFHLFLIALNPDTTMTVVKNLC